MPVFTVNQTYEVLWGDCVRWVDRSSPPVVITRCCSSGSSMFTDTQVTHKEIELLDILFASTAVAVEAVGAPVPEQLPVCQRF